MTFSIKKRTFGKGNFLTSDIFDNESNRVFPIISDFMSMVHIDSIDEYISEISNYSFDQTIEQDSMPETDLINDYVIRGLSGKPGMLQFVNYNIDEDIEEISQEDLLDIFQQWKKILQESK